MSGQRKRGRRAISDDSVRKLMTLPRDVSEYITAHGGSAFVVELVGIHRRAVKRADEMMLRAVGESVAR